MDHKAKGKDVKGDCPVKEPSEAAGAADHVTDEKEQDARDDLERATDVTCFGNSNIRDDLEE